LNKIIEITVTPDGSTKIETKGFIGPDCQEASRMLEKALGTKTAGDLKPEFYQEATTDRSIRSEQ
jgi:hypothetical protein